MGTRGFIIYIIRNKVYFQYNHWISYPHGLGADLTNCIIKLLQKYSFEELKEQMYNLKEVNDDTFATKEEINKLKEFSDLCVSSKNPKEWYVLLRKCQGNLDLTLKSGYILSQKFNKIEDCKLDLFIEFIYTVDFNNDKFYCNNELIGPISNMPANWYNISEEHEENPTSNTSTE